MFVSPLTSVIVLIAFRRMPAKPNATEEELKEVEVLSVSDVLEGVVDPKHQKAKEALAYIKRRHRYDSFMKHPS